VFFQTKSLCGFTNLANTICAPKWSGGGVFKNALNAQNVFHFCTISKKNLNEKK
jgi:hypothetical protein